jgi:FkbM family methyltransferase
MEKTLTLTMVDGVHIVVHDTLDLITPYVLAEQRDWFENEIRFVRRLLQPGGRVIDIGANHGVYTLSMAKALGPGGQVWAFEPASLVAGLLERSLAINGFEHVVVERSAVSDRVGQARLAVSMNSELNTLALDASAASATETVPLTTLDDGMARYGWRGIDLVKIDAEGEEDRILRGGSRFLAELSPLVLYEIRAGHDLQLGLVQSFASHGYSSYRLVPGLGLLAPFDPATKLDDFVLNLFACKVDRAEQLAARGLLVLDTPGAPLDRPAADAWRHTLVALPYGRRLATLWDSTVAREQSADVVEALALHAQSRDPTRTAAVRLAALQRSFGLLLAASRQPSAYLRLASLARVAAELGERNLAYGTLIQLCDALHRGRSLGPAEPFLSPSERFDSLEPGGAVANWVLAAAMEERERLGAHSSFFTGHSSLDALQAMQGLGFASDEMKRRLQLVQRRHATPGACLEPQS